MRTASSIGALAIMAALSATIGGAFAFDETKYPDLKGQWSRVRFPGVGGQPSFDQTKSAGAGQEAPLTAEYQAIFEANLKDQAAGGQGTDPTATCISPGMPRIMTAYEPMEIVVTPETTHILMEHIHDSRRIYTDGRPWPAEIEPSFAGYSIGAWREPDGSGRYAVLEAESRGFKGPRTYDAAGIPLHKDNRTVIKERFHLVQGSNDLLDDEITIIDHALTRPWTVTKHYRREAAQRPLWRESVCAENNSHVQIGGEDYYLSADRELMPAKKGQQPPDLKYFGQPKK
ncbi:MAG TPA: hypothetical protein VIY51_09760 [Xanthobacteraceae bacterium]